MTSTRRLFVVLAAALACSDSSGPSFRSSAPCDQGVLLADTDPLNAAKTIGICDGLVSAAWVFPDGGPDTTSANFHVGHGLMATFGPNNPSREGVALLALSTGTARTLSQPGYSLEFDKRYGTTPPAGFPQGEGGICPDPSSLGYDGIALSVVLKVPAGVRALAFEYAFFTREYPQWVCTTYVDQAVALITGVTGLPALHNVMLDLSSKPLLSSPTTIRACSDTILPNGAYPCPLGTGPLTGSGFETYGGSGWLRTANLPVTAGDTVRIRFMVWDTGDHVLDTSVLIDGFRWIP